MWQYMKLLYEAKNFDPVTGMFEEIEEPDFEALGGMRWELVSVTTLESQSTYLANGSLKMVPTKLLYRFKRHK